MKDTKGLYKQGAAVASLSPARRAFPKEGAAFLLPDVM